MSQNVGVSLQSLVLAVAWRSRQSVLGRKLNIGGDLEQYLVSIISAVDALIDDSTVVAYRPDGGEAEIGEVFSVARDARIDSALIDVLNTGFHLDFATEAELRTKRLSCYAMVAGSGENQKIYIRRADPVKLARKRLFHSLMSGPLTELEEPVLAFDEHIDVVIEQDRILILNAKGFESLFRDSEAVLAAAPAWVEELRTYVMFDDQTKDVLLDAVQRNSLHRRKLLSILESSYARTLAPKRIREMMKRHELPHEELLVDDVLILGENSIGAVLKLLNEDLYRGDFSDEHFSANGKRPFGGS